MGFGDSGAKTSYCDLSRQTDCPRLESAVNVEDDVLFTGCILVCSQQVI